MLINWKLICIFAKCKDYIYTKIYLKYNKYQSDFQIKVGKNQEEEDTENEFYICVEIKEK